MIIKQFLQLKMPGVFHNIFFFEYVRPQWYTLENIISAQKDRTFHGLVSKHNASPDWTTYPELMMNFWWYRNLKEESPLCSKFNKWLSLYIKYTMKFLFQFHRRLQNLNRASKVLSFILNEWQQMYFYVRVSLTGLDNFRRFYILSCQVYSNPFFHVHLGTIK